VTGRGEQTVVARVQTGAAADAPFMFMLLLQPLLQYSVSDQDEEALF
jgi:hypothetical protein